MAANVSCVDDLLVVGISGAEALDQTAATALVGPALVHPPLIPFAPAIAPGPGRGAVGRGRDADAGVAEGALDGAAARIFATLAEGGPLGLPFGVVVFRPAVIRVRTGRQRAPHAGHGRHSSEQHKRC